MIDELIEWSLSHPEEAARKNKLSRKYYKNMMNMKFTLVDVKRVPEFDGKVPEGDIDILNNIE